MSTPLPNELAIRRLIRSEIDSNASGVVGMKHLRLLVSKEFDLQFTLSMRRRLKEVIVEVFNERQELESPTNGTNGDLTVTACKRVRPVKAEEPVEEEGEEDPFSVGPPKKRRRLSRSPNPRRENRRRSKKSSDEEEEEEEDEEDEDEEEESTTTPANGDLPDPDSFEIVLSDARNRRKLTLSDYKGVLRADIREYYQDRSTEEWKPSQKGISLLPKEWEILCEAADDIDDAIRAREEAGGSRASSGGQRKKKKKKMGPSKKRRSVANW